MVTRPKSARVRTPSRMKSSMTSIGIHDWPGTHVDLLGGQVDRHDGVERLDVDPEPVIAVAALAATARLVRTSPDR